MKKILTFLATLLLGLNTMALEVVGDKIVDHMGNSVENKKYTNIVIIEPAVVEIMYMLGAEDSIAAIASTARSPIWPMEKTKDLASVGNLLKPSIEQVLSYTPDLVILNPMSTSFAETLKTYGLPFIVNEASSLEQIFKTTEVMGVITGNEDRAKDVVEKKKETLDNIAISLEKKPLNMKGAILFSTSPMMAFTDKSLPGEILETLGVENITKGLPGGRPIISPEYLVEVNPDVLIGSMAISKKEDILNSNPFVAHTNAGKNGNFLIADSTKILRGTPRLIDALEELYKDLEELN